MLVKGLVSAFKVTSILQSAGVLSVALRYRFSVLRDGLRWPDGHEEQRRVNRYRDSLNAFVRARQKALCSTSVARSATGRYPAGRRLGEVHRRRRHGTMEWMAETRDRRGDPRTSGAMSARSSSSASVYGPENDPREIPGKARQGCDLGLRAQSRHHDVIKGRLKEIATRFAARAGADVKALSTAPVMEKPLAAAAVPRLWQARTNLVSRGARLLAFPRFHVHDRGPEHGRARDRSLRLLPRLSRYLSDQCLPGPYQIDARCCISYLTIEHKGPIDRRCGH